MTKREVLTAAADLIEQKGWCQGVNARDVQGFEISCADKGAACFCLDGALQRVAGRQWMHEALVAYRFLGSHIEDTPVDWNDTPGRTAAEVIAKLREVAALPEAAE